MKNLVKKLSIVFITTVVLFLFVVSTFDFSTKKVSAGQVSISNYIAFHLAGGITDNATGGTLGAFGSSYVNEGVRCIVPGLSNLDDAHKTNVWEYGVNVLNNASTLAMGSMYNYGRVSVEFSIGYFNSSTGEEVSNSNSTDPDNKAKYPIDIAIVERKTVLGEDDNVMAVLRIWTKTENRSQLSGLNDFSLYMIEDDSSWTEYVGTGVAIQGNATLDSSFYVEFDNKNLFSAKCNNEGVIEKLDGINPKTGEKFSDVFLAKYAQSYDTVFLQIKGDNGFIHETEVLVRSMNGQSLANDGTSFTDNIAPQIRQPNVDAEGDITLNEYTVGSSVEIPDVYWATDFFGGISYKVSVNGGTAVSGRTFTVPSEVGYFTVDFIATDKAGNTTKREFTFYATSSDYTITTNIYNENKLYLNAQFWNSGGARFAAYFYNGNTSNKWVDMTNMGNSIYSVEIPAGTWPNVIFCRMNGSTTANNWDNKWNQSPDLIVSGNTKKIYNVTGWDKTGSWSSVNTNLMHEKVNFIPCENWKADDARFALYLFKSTNNDTYWLSLLDDDGDGIYSTLFEKYFLDYYDRAIFCRMDGKNQTNIWENKWNQSANITFNSSSYRSYIMPDVTVDKMDGWSGGTWITLTNKTYYYATTAATATAKITYSNNGMSTNRSMTKTTLNYRIDKEDYNVFKITSLVPSNGSLNVTFNTNINAGSKTAATLDRMLYNGTKWCGMVTTSFKGNYVGCSNEIVSRFEGSKIEHDIPEREGWVFNGWYSDRTCPDHLAVSTTTAIDGEYYGSWGNNFAVGRNLYFQPSDLWNSANSNNPYYYAYLYNYQGEAKWVVPTEAENYDGIYSLTIPEGNWSNVIFVCRKTAYANIESETTDAPFLGENKVYQSINIRQDVYSNICIIEPIMIDDVEHVKNSEDGYYAVWHSITFFNFIDSHEEVISNYCDSIAAEVEDFNLTRPGYTLGGWSVHNPEFVQDVTSVVLTDTSDLVADGATYYAYWYVTTTLVYTNADNVVSNITISTFEGIDLRSLDNQYIVPTRDGFTFAGWGNSSLITNPEEIITDALPAINGTYYANWLIETTFIANYSSIDNKLSNETITIEVLENTTITLPRTDYVKGYAMNGWYVSELGGDPLTGPTMVVDGGTYYAQWIEAPEFADIDLLLYYYYPSEIVDGNISVSETPSISYISLKAYANVYNTKNINFIDESYEYTLSLYINGNFDSSVEGVYDNGVIKIDDIIIERINPSLYKTNQYYACLTIMDGLTMIHEDVINLWTVETLVDDYVIDFKEGNDRELTDHEYLVVNIAHCDNTISGHKYDDNIYGNDYSFDENYHYKYCTVCKAVDAKEEHKYKGSFTYDPTAHWVECYDCGYRKLTDHHTYDNEVVNPDRIVPDKSSATCLTPVAYYYTCDCGHTADKYVDDGYDLNRVFPQGESFYYGDSLGHDYAVSYSWSGDEANPVLTVTLNCSRCNLDDKQIVYNKSNGLTQSNYVAPDCTTAGSRTFTLSKSYTYIDDKGVSRTVNYSSQHTYTVAALGHDFTSQTKTDTYLKSSATCQNVAVYYYKCSRCAEKGSNTYEYGSVAAHVYSKEIVNSTYLRSVATCSASATYFYACKWCSAKGTSYYSNGSVDANNHNYKFNSFVWDSDYTADAKLVCTHNSGHVEYVAAAMTYKDSPVATCTTTGTRIHTATYDGNTATKNQTIAKNANNHNYVTGYWDGLYNVSICSRCNTVKQVSKGTQVTGVKLNTTKATNIASNMVHTISFKGKISAPINSAITQASNNYPSVGTKIAFGNGAKSGDYIYVHIDWMYHATQSRAWEANAVRITGTINGNTLAVTYWLDGCKITPASGGTLIVTRFDNKITIQIKNASGSLVTLYDESGSNGQTSKTHTISYYTSGVLPNIDGGNSTSNGSTDIYDAYSVILYGEDEDWSGTTSIFAFDSNKLGTYGSTTRENYVLLNALSGSKNYTLEFDYKGTRTGTGYSNVMKFGAHMWYVNGDNYLEVYVYWDPGSGKRSHQIYEIQMTGKIDGTAVCWNSFWGDSSSSGAWGSGTSYTCYPANGGHMKIVKSGAKFTFTLTTGTTYQKTGNVTFTNIDNQAKTEKLSMNTSVSYNVILYADGDEFTISNIKFS